MPLKQKKDDKILTVREEKTEPKKERQYNADGSIRLTVEEMDARRKIQDGSLAADTESLNKALEMLDSGWQNSATVASTKKQFDKYMSNLSNIRDYVGGIKEHNADIEDYYQDISKLYFAYKDVNLDDYASRYGKFDSKDAYDQAIAEAQRAQEEEQIYLNANLDLQKKAIENLDEKIADAQAKQAELDRAAEGLGRYANADAAKENQSYLDALIQNRDSLGSFYATAMRKQDEKAKADEFKTKSDEFKAKAESIKSDPDFWKYVAKGIEDEDNAFYGFDYVDVLTDEEKSIARYFYGKDGYQSAQRYLNDIPGLDDRVATYNAENMRSSPDALKIAFGFAAGLASWAEGLSNLGEMLSVDNVFHQQEIEDRYGYIEPSMIQKQAAIVGESMTGLSKSLYGAAQSIGMMVPSIILSQIPVVGQAAGAVAFGAPIMGNEYAEYLNRGLSRDDAFIVAGIQGLWETASEYALGSIEGLGDNFIVKALEKSSGKFGKAVYNFATLGLSKRVWNALQEGGEEIIQGIGSDIIEGIRTGKFEMSSLGDYMYDGWLGFLTSAVMGLPSIGVDVANYATTRNIGKTAIKNGNISDITAKIKDTFSADSVAYKLADKVNDNTGAYKIGKMIREANATLSEQNKQDITRYLADKGVRESDAENITAWVEAVINGEKLTEQQKAILEANDTLKAAMQEALGLESVAKRVATANTMNAYALIDKDTIAANKTRGQSVAEELAKAEKKRTAAEAPAAVNATAETENIAEKTATEMAQESTKEAEGKTLYTDKNGNTTEVELNGFESVKDKTVKLSDGKSVKLDTISFPDVKTELVYDAVATMGAADSSATAIINTLSAASGVNNANEISNAMLAYGYGLTGEQSKLASIDNIPDNVKTLMYGIGRAEAKAKNESRTASAQKRSLTPKTSDKVVYEGEISKDLNPNQKFANETAKMFAKISPFEIHVFESFERDGKHYAVINGVEKETAANGWYYEGTNKIFIDLNAGNNYEGLGVFALAHETGHALRDWNADKWQALADAIVAEIDRQAEAEGTNTFAELQNQKYRQYKRIANNERKAIESGELDANKADYYGKTDAQLDDMAYEDVICDSLASLMTDTQTFKDLMNGIKAKDGSLWKRIKDAFAKFIAKLDEYLKNFTGKVETDAARAVQNAAKETRDQIRQLYVDTFLGASENIKKAQENAVAKSLKSTQEGMVHSLRYEEQHKADMQKYVDSLKGVAKEEAQRTMNRMTEILASFTKEWVNISQKIDSQFLNEWNAKTGRDRAFSIFKAQSGYKYNVELASMCKKGIPLFEAIDTIVTKRVMEETGIKNLGKAEKQILYDILKQHGFDIPCAICYVEQARQREGAVINAFLNGKDNKIGWNSTLDNIEAKMKEYGVDYTFESVSRDITGELYSPKNIVMDAKTQDAFFAAIKDIANGEIEAENARRREANAKKDSNGSTAKRQKLFSEITQATPQGILSKLKGTIPANLQIFRALVNESNSRMRFDPDVLYSSMTTRNIASYHQNFYTLFNSQGGTSGYKTKQKPVVYWGDLLSVKWESGKTRIEGGVRSQSNSDLQMYTLLDKVQMFADFSLKGYYVQEYTKVPAELAILGLSGAKVNASLIPMVRYRYKMDGNGNRIVDVEQTMKYAGLDENGELIFDSVEGIDPKYAFYFAGDKNYSTQVCGICIGYSDEHILKLLADKRIQMVIGFHDKTNDPSKRYAGAKYAKNYNGLNEAKGADGTVHIGFNQFVLKAEKAFGYDADTKTSEIDSIDYTCDTGEVKTFSANDIPKLAVEMYYNYCKDKGYTVAYEMFKGNENYYKLLADFGLYDSEGNYAPQQKVSLNIPTVVPVIDKSGKVTQVPLNEFVESEISKEMATRDKIAEELADTSENGVIPQFVEAVKAFNGENESRKLSSRVTAEEDAEYMDAYYDDDYELMQKLVDKAARDAGYDSPMLYHGTKQFGFTRIKTSGVEKGVSWSPFFAASREDIASSYVPLGKVREVSADIEESDVEEAIDERKESIKDLIDDFRRYIDRYFSEWVFGMTDNSYLEDLVGKANPDPGNGDGVYDVLDDIVVECFYDYQDQFEDYEDLEDWQENSDEAKKLYEIIVGIEAEKSSLAELESGNYSGGIYRLYANTNNLFVVDAEGKAWNELRPEGLPPLERYGHKDVPYRTRDVALWARDNGYDGVLFKNIYDNGAYGRTPNGDVYCFFNPESQVKSADSVTYDDDGDPIPLSERFNEANEDIRYSTRDSEGNELSKGQQEFFKDSKVRDENGNLLVVYHGTANGGKFTAFDPAKLSNDPRTSHIGQGFYFTNSESGAREYMSNMDIFGRAYKGANPNLFSGYLNIKSPTVVTPNSHNITYNQIRDIIANGNYKWFIDNGIAHQLQNAKINEVSRSKDQIKAMSDTEKIDLYSRYLAQNGDMFALQNMVRAYSFDNQADLLKAMSVYLKSDGIIWKMRDNIYQYVAFNSNQFKNIDNLNPTENEDIRYSLRDVPPVQPTTNEWKRGVTTAEAMRIYPNLWNVAADESETRNPTQITSTVGTYRKIYNILKSEGFNGTILDASSGLGYGTKAGIDEYGFNVEDIEPYPAKDYSPKYTDYSTLNKKYDVIISNAVLNVLPQDQRDALVVKMGEMLNDGGRIFINVRSLSEIQALQNVTDKKTGKPKNVKISDSEVAETSKGSYQKGFAKNELKAYLKDVFGDGYEVAPASKFGGTSVIVKKRSYSFDELSAKHPIVGRNVDISVKTDNRGVIDIKWLEDQIKSKCQKVNPKNADTRYYVECDDIGKKIEVGNKGIDHALQNTKKGKSSANEMETARIMLDLPYIVKNAIEVNISQRNNAGSSSQSILLGVASLNNGASTDYYGVKIVIENRIGENAELADFEIYGKLYSVNTKKIDSAKVRFSPNGEPLTNSVGRFYYNVSQLIQDVKDKFPDIFSDNVYQHFGGERIETPNTQYLQFSLRDPEASNRELLANALESTVKSETDAKYLADYKANIEKLNAEEAKLKDLKAQIKELSFAKGKRDTAKIIALQGEVTKTQNRIGIYDKKLLRLESTAALKKVVDTERDRLRKKLTADYKASLAEQREKAKQREADIRVAYQESRKNATQRRNATVIRNKIKAIANDLQQRLANSTETRFVPEPLVNGVVEVYNLIDQTGRDPESKASESKVAMRDALNNLKTKYDTLKNNKEYGYDFSSEFSEEFSSLIGELAEAVDGTPVRDMTLDQLQDVHDIISDIAFMVKTASKQILENESISNYEAGQEVIAKMKEISGKKLNKGQIEKFFREWTLNPMRAVLEMNAFDENAYLYKLFAALDEGRRKADTFKMTENKKIDALRESKEDLKQFNDAVETPIDFGLTDINGKPYEMTKMQAMQLVLTWDREQKNPKHIHLSQTGATIPDAKLQAKGKFDQALDNGVTIGAVTFNDISQIMSKFNEWDNKFLAIAREIFNEDSSAAINEVTMQTKHRPIATENAYIPYEIDKDYVASESENLKFNATIENMGMLKSVVPNASQPLIMRGLNSILDKHINDVAKVSGLTIPVRNFNKVFNMNQTRGDGGDTVKASISRTWGKGGEKLVDRAVAELQSSRPHDKIPLLNSIKSGFVVSTLASNISVWMKQAASYPTAGAILSNKALIKGLWDYTAKIKDGIHAQDVWDEIDAHTSQHWIRRQGLSSQELGEMNQSKGWANRLNRRLGKASPMNWIQAMDVGTTAALWYACKAEVEAKGITENDANYWDEVTSLYDKVIEETQPMYDSLHRAEITKNTLAKNFIMFQTQPIQNSGILRESGERLKMARKQYGKNSAQAKAAARQFRMAVTSQVASHFVFTLMTLIGRALLHKMNDYRDEDENVTFESVMAEFGKQFGTNYFSAIVPVFGNYAAEFAEKIIERNRFNVFSDPTVDTINGVLDATVDTIYGVVDTFSTLTNPSWDDFRKMSLKLAGIFGIPAENAYNIVNGAYANIQDIINGDFGEFEYGVERTNKQNLHNAYAAYKSGDNAEYKQIIQDMLDHYISNGKTEKEAKSTVRSSLTSNYKSAYVEAFKSGDLTEANEIRKFLYYTGCYGSLAELDETLKKWRTGK